MYYDHAVHRREGTKTTFELALDLLASGAADVGWMVTHRFRLEDYARVFATLAKRHRHAVLKAVFEF